MKQQKTKLWHTFDVYTKCLNTKYMMVETKHCLFGLVVFTTVKLY